MNRLGERLYHHAGPGTNWSAAPDSALPLLDPQGHPWGDLILSELLDRRGWCMAPEQHEAMPRAHSDLLALKRPA